MRPRTYGRGSRSHTTSVSLITTSPLRAADAPAEKSTGWRPRHAASSEAEPHLLGIWPSKPTTGVTPTRRKCIAQLSAIVRPPASVKLTSSSLLPGAPGDTAAASSCWVQAPKDAHTASCMVPASCHCPVNSQVQAKTARERL
eukprot:scaffold83891_cov93-Phaeocystis_antarctica.AAC.3